MAENKIDVRLKEQYHTIEWWTTNNPVLLQGEPAYVVVGTVQVGDKSVPSILTKVGDGVHAFNDLEYDYAMAADVYTWAKKETMDYNDLPAMLLTKVTTLESEVCGRITNTELEELLK